MPERVPQVSQFGSVYPAPFSKLGDVDTWKNSLINDEFPSIQRMLNLFSLRNEGIDESCLALCFGFNSSSALLRHESSEVIGPTSDMFDKYTLQKNITDSNPEVSESCEVALDLLAWSNTEEWNETKW